MENIRKYLEKGEKDNKRRKDVYKYDKNGKFVKHWKTVTEASKDCNLGKNIIAEALDQKISINGYIWRTSNVKFTKKECEEIGKGNREAKRQLKSEDHDKIREKIRKK